MHKEGEKIHVTDTEASAGSKEGVVRWVLAGGLLLAIVLLSTVWIIPALSSDDSISETQPGTGTAADIGDNAPATPADQTATQGGPDVIEN